MNVVFRNPAHANGGCIFSDYQPPADTYVTPCPAVFHNPEHANGCIFFDNQPVEARTGGTAGRDDRLYALMRDDEEVLAVIMAATQRWGFSGTIH